MYDPCGLPAMPSDMCTAICLQWITGTAPLHRHAFVMLTVQTGFLGALRHSHKDDTSMCRLLNISVASSSNTHLSVFRGYKVVVKFFPNEAANLEPVVELLLKIEEEVCPSVTALHCIALHTFTLANVHEVCPTAHAYQQSCSRHFQRHVAWCAKANQLQQNPQAELSHCTSS